MAHDILAGSEVHLSKKVVENLQAIYDQGGDLSYAILNARDVHEIGPLIVNTKDGETVTIKGYEFLGAFHVDAFVLA